MMMVYIGGVGTIVGPIIGAVFFVVVREFLVLRLAELHLIVFGVIFILVVMSCPAVLSEFGPSCKKRLPVDLNLRRPMRALPRANRYATGGPWSQIKQEVVMT